MWNRCAIVYSRRTRLFIWRPSRLNNTMEMVSKFNKYQSTQGISLSINNWFQDKVCEPFLTVKRMIHITIKFLPLLMCYPILSRQIWYQWLTASLQDLGPCFIKLGQWASTRIDIFPQELCHELQQLHSNVQPHSWAHTEQIIKSGWNLDKNLDSIDIFFKWLHKNPVGCGSIAQVYLCKLPKWEKPLVIKVLHPRVKEYIDRDLRIVYNLANLIDRLLPQMKWISLPQEVQEFETLMNQQLDLRLEAINLNKFNKNFSNWDNIVFPKPIMSLTQRDILVEEFCYGIPMQWFLNVKNKIPTKEQKTISEPFINSFLKMMIVDNFTHTDLHPGNVIITTDNKSMIDQLYSCHNDNTAFISKLNQLFKLNYNYILKRKNNDGSLKDKIKICLIDCGLVTQLTPTNKKNFMDLFIAMSHFEGKEIGKLMIERSRTPDSAININEFIEKVDSLISDVKKKTFTLGTISVGTYLTQMFNIVSQHHVKLESDFVSIMVAIFLLEGIGRQLDSSLDLFDKSTPFLEQYALQNQIHKINVLKLWVALKVRKFGNIFMQELKKMTPG